MSDQHIKLGELLLRRQIIEINHLEMALANQVVYSGRIGTNLVELGVVDINYIGRALSIQLGFPHADNDELNLASENSLAILSGEVCAQYQVFPIRIEAGILHLAMIDPCRQDILLSLTQEIGLTIKPYVCPELRLLYFLEHRYGIPREKRFLRFSSNETREQDRRTYLHATVSPDKSSSFPSAKTHASSEAAELIKVGIPVDEPSSSYQPMIDPIPDTQNTAGMRSPSAEFQLIYLDEAQKSPVSNLPTAPVTPEEQSSNEVASIIHSLNKASTGGDVARLIVRPIFPNTSLSVLFWVRGHKAVGCIAHNSPLPLEIIRQLVVPLDEPSLLQWAFFLKSSVRGEASSDSLQIRIAEFLQAPPSGEVCIFPISFHQKIINLLCLHSAEGTAFPSTAFTYLKVIAEAASLAYQRLIKEVKK